MPVATGSVDACESEYAAIERELETSLDSFLSQTIAAHDFFRAMEKIHGQLELAEKMQNARTDLELNETAVIADNLEEELHVAERLALSAVLSETQEEWAGELEDAKRSLESLGAYLKKMKSAARESDTAELRGAMLSFKKHSKSCKTRLVKIQGLLAPKKHPIYSQVRAAKSRVKKLKANVGKVFDSLSRSRLHGQVKATKADIFDFMKKAGSGRFFVDHKHLTLSSQQHTSRVPLTQAIKFALEELMPIQKSLARLGRGALISGRYECGKDGITLRVGERSVAGDSVIYKEKTCRISQ